MTFLDAVKVASAILVGLGGGGTIVLACPAFLASSGQTVLSKNSVINMLS